MSYHYTNTNSYGGLGQYYGFGNGKKKPKKGKAMVPFRNFIQKVASAPGLFRPKARPAAPAMPKIRPAMPASPAKMPPLKPLPMKDAAPELRPSDVLPVSVASKAKAAAVAMDEDMMAPGFMPPGLMKMPPGLMKMAPDEEVEPATPESGATIEPAVEAPPVPKVLPIAPGYMMPGMMPPPPMRPGRIGPIPKPVITPQQARLGTIAAALGAGLLFF